tara:strand:- start:130 stop:357 length:228 start_codon:yes stop_codon:yes gene_type:complete
MKKIIALLAIVSVFGFVACNNAAETESTEETTEVADSVAATEEAATEEAPAEEATDSTATEEAPAEEAAVEEAAE